MKRTLIHLAAALGMLTVLTLGSASVASAQPATTATTICYPSCEPTTVTPPQHDAQPTTPAPQGGSQLAFTGSDVLGTVVIAAVLVGGGFLLVRLSGRRRLSR